MSWAHENSKPFLPFKRKRGPKVETVISPATKKALRDIESVDTLAQFESLEHSSRERWR